MNRIIRVLIINSLITLLLIIFLDVTMFNFLPNKYVYKIREYRQKSPPDVGGRGGYPKNYFIKNEERGFDIGQNKNAYHWVEGIKYPIWSNSLGCFDNEHAAYDQYVYFAGDSYTWGYTPFDQKFGTIIERVTDTQILKCGVTHTGQIHQFSKFVELVKNIGKLPKAIFVFYTCNDVANDYAHPHTTVIQGWQVNNAYLNENDEIFRVSPQDLEKRVTDKINEIKIAKNGWWKSTKRIIKYYSLTINIFVYFKDYIASKVGTTKPLNQINLKRKMARSILWLPQRKNGRYWYLDNPKAQRNKEALLKFKKYSIKNNIKFSVVLIPNQEQIVDTNLYEGVREFLGQNKIRYVDLTFKFGDIKFSSKDLYWKNDGHLNPLGNEVVSEILINEFSDIFQND